jgi:Fe-S-cluster-containing hydrogenase component 2
MKVLTADPENCSGCRMCEVACTYRHHDAFWPAVANLQVVSLKKEGIHYPILCEQCERAPCAEVCPAQAIYKEPDTGAWVVDVTRCIGCRNCVAACPLGAMNFNPEEGVSTKCDLCAGDPTCVKVCPMDVLDYIDVEKISLRKKRTLARRIFMEAKR